jgi:hypothetical protein
MIHPLLPFLKSALFRRSACVFLIARPTESACGQAFNLFLIIGVNRQL